MLAAVRRGPFSPPSSQEQIEYLLTRVRKTETRKDVEKHALEHVLSFQRRVLACKREFLKRQKKTPLGVVTDYWDRTEAQQRGTLHSHCLCWMKKRKTPGGWKALQPIPRLSPGCEHKQRPFDQRVPPITGEEAQEDSVYQLAEVARISAEMPRADVSGEDWGGFDVETLRIAGLCRTQLIRLNYLHTCTPIYCLKGRSTCRLASRRAATTFGANNAKHFLWRCDALGCRPRFLLSLATSRISSIR